jgi:hypothetical protein
LGGQFDDLGKKQIGLFGMVQSFRELIDVEQHAPQNIEKLLRVIRWPHLNHEPHGLQHGGQAGVFVSDDLKGTEGLHDVLSEVIVFTLPICVIARHDRSQKISVQVFTVSSA